MREAPRLLAQEYGRTRMPPVSEVCRLAAEGERWRRGANTTDLKWLRSASPLSGHALPDVDLQTVGSIDRQGGACCRGYGNEQPARRWPLVLEQTVLK